MDGSLRALVLPYVILLPPASQAMLPLRSPRLVPQIAHFPAAAVVWKLVRIAVACSAQAVCVIVVPTDTSSDHASLHSTAHAVGSILREATIPAVNIFCDAMRGLRAPPAFRKLGWTVWMARRYPMMHVIDGS